MSKPLLTACLLIATALVQAEAPPSEDIARANELIDRARAIRAEADTRFRETEAACYEKFLVNRCRDKARQERLDAIRAARAMEIEGREIELAAKRRIAAEQNLPERYVGSETAVPPSTALPTTAPDPVVESIRARREAEAAAAEARAAAERRQSDAERAAGRARAEAAAAERAERAARDRERYDERLRKRAAEN